jgi:trk system potassium uptake protein TrkA
MAEEVSSITCLTGTEAEVMEFLVKPDAPATRGTLAEINFPKEAIVGGVIRGKSAHIAHGETHIKPYDRVVVFALPGVIHTIGRFFN